MRRAAIPLHEFPNSEKESAMARGRKARDPEDDAGEVKKIDAERAKKIILGDILPNVSTIGEHAQEVSTAYKLMKKECGVPSHIARLSIKWKDMEDAKRDHELRALNAMLQVFDIGIIEPDLVDKAEGKNGQTVVPGGGLATLMGIASDGEETDLADVGEDIAGEHDESAPGTGAAAIAAMKAAAEVDA